MGRIFAQRYAFSVDFRMNGAHFVRLDICLGRISDERYANPCAFPMNGAHIVRPRASQYASRASATHVFLPNGTPFASLFGATVHKIAPWRLFASHACLHLIAHGSPAVGWGWMGGCAGDVSAICIHAAVSVACIWVSGEDRRLGFRMKLGFRYRVGIRNGHERR